MYNDNDTIQEYTITNMVSYGLYSLVIAVIAVFISYFLLLPSYVLTFSDAHLFHIIRPPGHIIFPQEFCILYGGLFTTSIFWRYFGLLEIIFKKD